MFRRDRVSRVGGVFILVRNLYIANRVQEWETDCEILWVKLQLAGSVPLHIAAYYKPSESDTVSQTQRVLKSLKVNSNGVNGKGPHMGIGRF